MKNKELILVTGAAGFIGYHFSKALLKEGFDVIGVDNLNNYYSPKLKKDRISNIIDNQNFTFSELDISNFESLNNLFLNNKIDIVVNLAAQAGVRHSINHPYEFINTNIKGFVNVLEISKKHKISHVLYASSSSVYGNNQNMPFKEKDNVDYPISLYAASKKSNELIAHSYAHLFNLPVTGLRFFTVYGPWGRPDMAYFSFTKSIMEGKQIDVFNNGEMERDFTYIDDLIYGMLKILNNPPNKRAEIKNINLSNTQAPYYLYNIGNNKPISLEVFISAIENAVGRKAKKNYLPMQPGDVKKTFADISKLNDLYKYQPKTDIFQGIEKFVDWYKEYNSVN